MCECELCAVVPRSDCPRCSRVATSRAVGLKLWGVTGAFICETQCSPRAPHCSQLSRCIHFMKKTLLSLLCGKLRHGRLTQLVRRNATTQTRAHAPPTQPWAALGRLRSLPAGRVPGGVHGASREGMGCCGHTQV